MPFGTTHNLFVPQEPCFYYGNSNHVDTYAADNK